MRKLFLPIFVVATLMFAYAPIMIADAPYESTMLLVQKIFYFHVPAWFVMFTAIFISGICSAHLPVQGRSPGRPDCAGGRGDRGHLRIDGTGHRPALGAQGVGRLVAVGRHA